LDDQDETVKKKRAKQQRKVLVFTFVMGVLVAVGALGGLFVGLLINGGSLENNPALPLALSVLGLALSLVAADKLTKKLLANWIA
jgi:hypothetical protein